jgi:hypothetical protein
LTNSKVIPPLYLPIKLRWFHFINISDFPETEALYIVERVGNVQSVLKFN